MDFGFVTAEYVLRMWGGEVPMEEIEKGQKEIRETGIYEFMMMKSEKLKSILKAVWAFCSFVFVEQRRPQCWMLYL